jgi:TolA-binding protein
MRRRVLVWSVLFFLLGIIPSCAYFNTFYNTKKLYREALKAREKRKGDRPTSAEIQAYDKTIEKASKVLTNYPDSKYIDDALMILGECLYYKEDYLKARRKFEELLTLFPQSGYREKARLWLAKSNLRLRDFAQSETTLREILESSKNKRLREEAELLLGDLYLEQESYEAAVEAYRRAAASGGREKRAKAFFNLGQALLELDKPDDAVEAFSNARRLTRERALKNNAHFQTGVALKLAGEYDEAIRVFTGLLSDATFRDSYPDAKLQIADCLRRQGNFADAIEWYETITTDYARTAASAQAHFELGLIYEEDLRDFETAKKHYDRVRPEYSASEWAQEATQRSKDITTLLRLRATIDKMEGRKKSFPPASDVVARRQASRRPPADEVDPELLALRRDESIPKLRSALPDTGEVLADEDDLLLARRAALNKQKAEAAAAPKDSLSNGLSEAQKDQLVKSKMQLAELYLLEYAEVDSALKQYVDIVERYPDHPLAPRALYAIAYGLREFVGDSALADSTLRFLLEHYPDSPQGKAVAAELGLPDVSETGPEELFHEAEAQLFDKNDPRRALRTYQQVVERFPESQYAPKALYAIAYIHETRLFNRDAALSTYKKLADDYPQSPFGKQAAKKVWAVEQARKAALASAETGKASADGGGAGQGKGLAGKRTSRPGEQSYRTRRPSLREHLQKLEREASSERKRP